MREMKGSKDSSEVVEDGLWNGGGLKDGTLLEKRRRVERRQEHGGTVGCRREGWCSHEVVCRDKDSWAEVGSCTGRGFVGQREVDALLGEV